MTEDNWRQAWREVLRAKFGDRLRGERLEAAVDECDALRTLWGPLAESSPGASLDNAEQPFPNPITAVRGGKPGKEGA